LIVTQDNADRIALLIASFDTDSLGSPVADVLGALQILLRAKNPSL